MKHRLLISVFLILILSLSLLTACGQKSSPADPEDASAEMMSDESDDSLKVIGIKAGSNTFVTLKNKTGQDIRDISVKASTEEEYPAGLLAASDALKNNESRVLYYTLKDDKNATYDVRLSLEDGTECVLHSFPFNDTENCTIWLDGVAYIDYLSNSTGNKESTRTVELNTLLAQEEGISLEELTAQQGSKLTAAATPSPSAAVKNNTSGTSGRSSNSGRSSGSSSYSGGSSSSGSNSSTNNNSSNNSSSGNNSNGSTNTETDTGNNSSSGSGGNDSGSSTNIGGDEAYMDDDLSGSTVD